MTDIQLEEWNKRQFETDIVMSFMNELCRALDFSYMRMVRSPETPDNEFMRKTLEKNAEWLKAVLPMYIDTEVKRLLTLHENH